MTELADIPAEQWEEAQRRERVLRPLLDMRAGRRAAIADAARQLNISSAWAYSLFRRFRNAPQTSSLVSRPGGRPHGFRFLDPRVEHVIEEKIRSFFLTRQKPKFKDLVLEVRRECRSSSLPPPSVAAIRRRLQAVPRDRIVRERQGAKAAREMFGPVRERFEVSAPLELVQIDHTVVDVMVVDEVQRQPIGHPWLTVALDVHTRMVLGLLLSLDHPSATSVGLCLAHAILPKDGWLAERGVREAWPAWGLPTGIHLDNAKEFRSHALRRGCEEHGIVINYRPVATPYYGGHIERLIGRIMGRVHLLPGTTFSNVVEKGEYDSEASASMTLAELERWLALEITGNYHASLHRGLGSSPLAAWNRALENGFTPRTASDPQRLLLDFLPFEERTVRRDGVHLFNIAYWSDALAALMARGIKSVTVKYDPRNLSRVYVRAQEGPYREVPYRDLGHPRITLAEHRAAAARLRADGRRTIDENALFCAVAEQRALTNEAAQRSKAARRAASEQRTRSDPLLGTQPPRMRPRPTSTTPELPEFATSRSGREPWT